MHPPLRSAPIALIGALLLAACASAPRPQTLDGLRAREASPIASTEVTSPDGFLRAWVPARPVGAMEVLDDAYLLRLDVGGESPVDCWLYRDGVDFAASLGGLSESSFAAIEAGFGPVEERQIERVDAGVLGESPFLGVDWLYRIAGADGAQVGEIKHLIASKSGRGVYCQHNELGYARTFRRVVGALLAGLTYAEGAPSAPYFTQVSTLAVEGMRVGLERTTLTRDAEGDTRVDTTTSLVVPVASDTLQTSDSFAVEFARMDGALINQVHVETANGELVTQLELNPASDGGWEVRGTFQTRPLSARLHSAQHPSSWLGEALALRETIARDGVGGEVRLVRWVPQADPTRLTDQTLSIERRVEADRFGARLDTGGLEADLVVDPVGSVASGSVALGFAELEIERVYVGGAF